jgi:hypothetical protein
MIDIHGSNSYCKTLKSFFFRENSALPEHRSVAIGIRKQVQDPIPEKWQIKNINMNKYVNINMSMSRDKNKKKNKKRKETEKETA